jgi:NAD(P)-dependent dehydrogenase (short-subunit alcohol dehydrogenase family)
MTGLQDKYFLITGAGVRVGRSLALALAREGANLALHYGRSQTQAAQTAADIEKMGRQAVLLQADLNEPDQVSALVERAQKTAPLDGLINNASIFENLDWKTTSLEDWNRHLMVNLTTPFLLSQAFARQVSADHQGRIVNLLDWRALRPGADHLPYTISKVALAGLTRSLAQAFAPQIQVNGVALGAILPPADGADTSAIIRDVPARRWADLAEVGQAVIFLLSGPTYITGEILHVDGGRHLV